MPPTTRVPLCLFNTHTRAHKRQMSNQSTHINTHASPEIVCGGGNKKDDRSRGESSAHPTQATAQSPPPKSLNASSSSSQRTQPVLLILIVWQRNESRRMRNIYPPTHITSHHIHTIHPACRLVSTFTTNATTEPFVDSTDRHSKLFSTLSILVTSQVHLHLLRLISPHQWWPLGLHFGEPIV